MAGARGRREEWRAASEKWQCRPRRTPVLASEPAVPKARSMPVNQLLPRRGHANEAAMAIAVMPPSTSINGVFCSVAGRRSILSRFPNLAESGQEVLKQQEPCPGMDSRNGRLSESESLASCSRVYWNGTVSGTNFFPWRISSCKVRRFINFLGQRSVKIAARQLGH